MTNEIFVVSLQRQTIKNATTMKDTTKLLEVALGIMCIFISVVSAIGTIGAHSLAQVVLLIISVVSAIYGVTRFFNDK